MRRCPVCQSPDWDYANVGLIGAIVCTDCGELYMMKDEITMKNFKVTACYYTYCTAEIEAENEEQAYEIARNTDGGFFTDSGDLGDWHINDVTEITE
jgi:hypothetical protein